MLCLHRVVFGLFHLIEMNQEARNITELFDAQDIYEKCEASGTRVQMVALKGAFHAFAVMGYGTPETRKIVEDCIDFMRTVTAG